jgi:hypothetical protein
MRRIACAFALGAGYLILNCLLVAPIENWFPIFAPNHNLKNVAQVSNSL